MLSLELLNFIFSSLRTVYSLFFLSSNVFLPVITLSISTCSPSITIVLIPSFSTLTWSRIKSSLKTNTEPFLSSGIIASDVTVKSGFRSSIGFNNSMNERAMVVLPLPLRPKTTLIGHSLNTSNSVPDSKHPPLMFIFLKFSNIFLCRLLF